MIQTLNEIETIDNSLLGFQDMLAKIEDYRLKSNQDIAAKQQKAELIYKQAIEHINNQKQQVEATNTQALTYYKQKRKEVEDRSQAQYCDCEKQIRSFYSAIIQENTESLDSLRRKISVVADNVPKKKLVKIVPKPINMASMAIKENELKKMYESICDDLYRKILDDSFRAKLNRFFHTHGYFSKTKMKLYFLEKAGAYESYLNDRVKSATEECSSKISNEYQKNQSQKQKDIEQIALQEKNANELRMRNLQTLYDQAVNARKTKTATLDNIEQTKKHYEEELIARRDSFTVKFNNFINTALVTQFYDRVKAALVGTGASNADWTAYDFKAKYPKYSIGDFLLPIKATEPKFLSELQTKIPNAFRSGFFRIPLLLNSNESSRFFVNYRQYDKNAICEFVQCVILQKLRCAEAGNIEVYFAEPDRSGQILGPLAAPIQENESIYIYNINSKDSIKSTLKKFASDIDAINGLLGDYHSIYEYNQNCRPHIKERCLVLSDIGGIIDKEDWELLNVIWNNSFRCGVTIVIVSAHSISDIPSLYPHTDIDVSYLNSKDLYLVNCVNQKCSIKYGQHEIGSFILLKMTKERKEFVGLYRNAVKKSRIIDNKFATYFDGSKIEKYKNAKNAIELPILLKNIPDEKPCNFVMDSINRTHTLLTGASGSGKSSFLHMIISSIVMNYHPDDVELWLVDYGRSAFQKYVTKRPKHIRFVSLEKTESFTYSFLEYVDNYFQNRVQQFKKDSVDNIPAYRNIHGDHSMPRIVLIVDEFHYMTQHTKESYTHNKILENILRDYRKYGLSCIFSDQTSNTGLTDNGAKQIKNRMAMSQNGYQEIIDTLGVSKSNFTAEKLHEMERTGTGEIWCKAFFGADEKDFTIEQFKTIHIVDSDIKTVLETSLKRDDIINFDTTFYTVDGEERAPISLEGVSSVLKNTETAEPTFCMGVPTSIEPFFSFELEQRYGNNVLVAGRNSKIGNDILAELLLSAALKENVRTIVFVDPREKKLKEIRNMLDDAFKTLNRLDSEQTHVNTVEIYSDYRSICGLIREFGERIKRREMFNKPTVIMWLSMLDIFDELSVYKSYQQETESKHNAFDMSAEEAFEVSDEMLRAMAEQAGLSVEAIKNLSTVPEEAQTKLKEEEGCIYNAIDDINTLLSNGGRYSLYSIVPLDNASDIKRLKGFQLDNFIHKIGYKMSGTDSYDFYLGKKAADIEDDEIALYTDGIKTCTFRPFLLK